MDDTLEWTSRTGGSSSLPGEIIRAVLSLLGPQEIGEVGVLFYFFLGGGGRVGF